MAAHAKVAEPNVVNGINVDDLFALIEGVKRDATKAKTNWHVTTTWRGQTRSRAQVDGFGIGGEQVPRRFTIDIDANLANWVERIGSPIRRNICWQRSTPASWWATWRSARCTESPSKA
jgi:hypothetical protein